MNEKTTPAFKPAWWLPGPHLQTLWAALARRCHLRTLVYPERLELPDGDFLDLHWTHSKKGRPPIVLILHGLSGNARSSYAQGLLAALHQRGWQGVLMHFRGCSGVPNRLARSYHAGETGDLQQVLDTLVKRKPGVPLFVVGYSLGGNVLLKWLGETGQQSLVTAACAVSVPFELAKSADRLNTGFSRVYQWRLIHELMTAYRKKFQHRPSPLHLDDRHPPRNFWEFDDAITAPLHGFKDVHDYYAQSSSRQFLKNIQTPTLIVHAQDDPFTHLDALPTAAEVSSDVSLELLEKGGHVGFVSGKYPWKPSYWSESRVLDYFEKIT